MPLKRAECMAHRAKRKTKPGFAVVFYPADTPSDAFLRHALCAMLCARSVLVFLCAEIFNGLLRTGSAVAEFFEHGFHHAIVEFLVFFVGPVGKCPD